VPPSVFYSFHWDYDKYRVAQVRNMGVVTDRPIASDNDWEQIKRGGDRAIQQWIDGQMKGTTCCVVLVGMGTANRQWVNYEIAEAWKQRKGVVAVRIHRLKDLSSQQSLPGANPLDFVTGPRWLPLSLVARIYDPPYWDSKAVYGYIYDHLREWIDEAIQIRAGQL